MGNWGMGLYSSDTACDVRDEYRNLLKEGMSGAKATRKLIKIFADLIDDKDDGPVFYLALADTSSKMGRLEENIKQKAIEYINSELAGQQTGICIHCISKTKLIDLKQRLEGPQRKPTTVRIPKPIEVPWQAGDVFAYRLEGDFAEQQGFANRFMYFVVIEKQKFIGNLVPVVYFYNICSSSLLKLDDVTECDIIHQFFKPIAYKNDPNRKETYKLMIGMTSLRNIPNRRITHIGRTDHIKKPMTEDEHEFFVLWKNLDKYIIENYQTWGI